MTICFLSSRNLISKGNKPRLNSRAIINVLSQTTPNYFFRFNSFIHSSFKFFHFFNFFHILNVRIYVTFIYFFVKQIYVYYRRWYAFSIKSCGRPDNWRGKVRIYERLAGRTWRNPWLFFGDQSEQENSEKFCEQTSKYFCSWRYETAVAIHYNRHVRFTNCTVELWQCDWRDIAI